MTATHRSWDDYFIPGTRVLQNKLTTRTEPYGTPDQTVLTTFEELAGSMRLAELAANPIEGRFDYDHMKAIHYHLFQDVYEWAGEERTAPNGAMTKRAPDVVNFAIGDPRAPMIPYAYFPAGEALAAGAEKQYALIAEADYLRGLPKDAFVTELAERWSELNVVHSFREGNTRSQFVFFTQLADNAGYTIDAPRFAHGQDLRTEFIAGRFEGQATGSSARLAAVLDKAIKATPKSTRGSLQEATRVKLADQIQGRAAGAKPPGYQPPNIGRAGQER